MSVHSPHHVPDSGWVKVFVKGQTRSVAEGPVLHHDRQDKVIHVGIGVDVVSVGYDQFDRAVVYLEGGRKERAAKLRSAVNA